MEEFKKFKEDLYAFCAKHYIFTFIVILAIIFCFIWGWISLKSSDFEKQREEIVIKGISDTSESLESIYKSIDDTLQYMIYVRDEVVPVGSDNYDDIIICMEDISCMLNDVSWELGDTMSDFGEWGYDYIEGFRERSLDNAHEKQPLY